MVCHFFASLAMGVEAGREGAEMSLRFEDTDSSKSRRKGIGSLPEAWETTKPGMQSGKKLSFGGIKGKG